MVDRGAVDERDGQPELRLVPCGRLRFGPCQYRWEVGGLQEGDRPRPVAGVALADLLVAATAELATPVAQQERVVGVACAPEDELVDRPQRSKRPRLAPAASTVRSVCVDGDS